MSKILIVYPHGLGDHILLTPALRKYKQICSDTEISLASLQRFGSKVEELLEFTFVDEFLPILPDPWENVKSYDGYLDNIRELDRSVKYEYLGKYDNIITLPLLRQAGFKMHKIFRAADELGIKFDRIEELITELTFREDYAKKAMEYLSQYDKPWLILHNKAGNPPKEFESDIIEKMMNEMFNQFTIFEFGRKSCSRSIELPEDDMRFSKALIAYVDFICAIDSVVMHIAGAFRKNLLAMFKSTPVHQAIPLFGNVQVAGNANDLTEILNWNKYKQDILNYFNNVDTSYNSSVTGQCGGKRDSAKRWRYIEPILVKKKSGKILDIGCNNGYFSILAAQMGFDVLGLDTDPKMIESAKKAQAANNKCTFELLEKDLLDRLKEFKDKEFEFTFYMSVHHHIYEQYSAEVADQILSEVGRISKNVIFDMGQSNEEGSEWTPWINLIPKFTDHRTEFPKWVSEKLGISTHVETICSEKIHGVERWLFWFSDELPEHMKNKKIRFGDKEYQIVDQFRNRHKSKEDVRYFTVSDSNGNKYFVKEQLYNDWLSEKFYPNDSLVNFADDQFDRTVAAYKASKHVVKPIAIQDQFILFEYFDWRNLGEIGSLNKELYYKIIDEAHKILEAVGIFDLNINNILIKDGEFKFIDFELAECDIEKRINRLRSLVTDFNKRTTQLKVLPSNYYYPMCYWAHMITFRCNGNCPFCIVDGRGKHVPREELSGKEILNWWNNLYHEPRQRLSLIGGETTLHKDLVEIVNNLEDYYITITTNCKGEFWESKKFKQLKPRFGSTLRINTSYHPHALEPEEYVSRINEMRDCGLYVDQIAFVYIPEIETKWKERIEKVRNSLPELKSPPFLGFWTEENGYAKDFRPDCLYPNEGYWDQESARRMCGIYDYTFYRKMCGQSQGTTVMCPHGIFSLIIDPSGNYFNCHYRLYYNIKPICNIKDFRPINLDDLRCEFYGLCNWCDLPRVDFAIKNVTADNINWLEKL